MAKLLIVEDDPQVRDMLHQTLEQEGYEIEEAEDGRQAIRQYQEKQPDLVITDIIMPGKDGVEAIHSLRREHPDVKIIAISGGSANISGDDLLQTAKKLGASRVFSKPVDLEELSKAVAEVIRG